MPKSVREHPNPFGDIKSPNGDGQESGFKFVDFAARLHSAAADKSMNAASIAKELSLTRGTMKRYWDGERLPPSDTLVDLAELLDVSERWLVRGDAGAPGLLRDAADSEWLNLPIYDLRDFDDLGKGSPISSLTMRRDWLYLSLGETSGLWLARTLAPDPIRGLPAGAPIVCKDLGTGEGPFEGQHYLFRVNGGILLARFSYRGPSVAQLSERVNENVVTPDDLEREDHRYYIVARVLGALARPFV